MSQRSLDFRWCRNYQLRQEIDELDSQLPRQIEKVSAYSRLVCLLEVVSRNKHASIYDGIADDCHAGKLHCRGVYIYKYSYFDFESRTAYTLFEMRYDQRNNGTGKLQKCIWRHCAGFWKNFSLPCDSTLLKWLNWIVVFQDQKQMFPLLQCTSQRRLENKFPFFALRCMRLTWIMKSVEGKENKPYWESKVASQRMQHDSKV